jgi:apoptosis-stimulating of p53 protein 1
MTLTDLQEMAIRQQKQIEINQQLLLAKEKRLKALKLDEQRNQQLALLSQGGGGGGGTFSSTNTLENTQKLENLKQNVLGQELKIFKLKQLRNQILEYKLSNSNMYSELDLIKSLFSEKERELVKAISKVTELTKQIGKTLCF